MTDKGGNPCGHGALARALHSIRTQYSLATALFLLMILAVFYVGGRIVLVHLVREAEQQVKEIGLDISRLAYRDAERVKRQNLVASAAVKEALDRSVTPAAILSANEFSGLSLVAVYGSDGTLQAGASRGRGGEPRELSSADFAPYARRIAAWMAAASGKGGRARSEVGILRVKGVSHYVSLVPGITDSQFIVMGSPFDSDAFAAQVNENFGGVDIRVTNRRADVALSIRETTQRAPAPAGSFGFSPMLSEALNFYSGGFWDFGGNPFEAVFAIRDIAGNAITMIAVSLPRTFSDVTRSALGRLTFFISMLGIVLILPIFWFQGRVLLNPLTKMTESIRRLGERHRDTDCPRLEWKGKDEFALLAASVNSMLETISARTVALAQMGSRQRALIEGLPDALTVFDTRCRLVSITKQPEGVPPLPGFEVGEPLSPAVYGEEGAKAFDAALARSFAEGRDSVLHLSVKGDAVRHFEVRLARMDDMFSLAIVRDVTREVAEHAMRVAAEAREHDSSKRESLTLFAAGIAHDVNNVLSVVLSTAEAALAGASHEDVKADMDVIRDAVKRGSAMTRELMAYAGETNIRLMRANSAMIIKDVQMLAERVIGDNVSVSYDLAEGLPDVDVDLNQFWKVLFNMVKNASEAFAGHPGRISLSTSLFEMTPEKAADFISEHPIQPAKGVVFAIADDGPGIPASLLPRLFDPYVSSKSLGRGLGLATVRTIVEAHGGAISVTSSPGRGTTFRIYLPPSRLPVQNAAEVVQPAPAQQGGMPAEVLVVDNDEAILKTSAILLKSLKVKPHVARNRRESLAILRRFASQVGVVLLDANLNGIDTLRLLDAFRIAAPNARVVISSGMNEEKIAKMFEGRPYDGFLGKPYSLAELKTAIMGGKV